MTDQDKLDLADQILQVLETGEQAKVYRSAVQPRPGQPNDPKIIVERQERSKTERGFRRGEFTDRYGAACSTQESSLATEDCIWVGLEHESHDPATGRPIGVRMHLTREAAGELAHVLLKFSYTGELP